MQQLPPFSEMLRERRCSLGLTLEQASRTLKLKQDILVAFETGDFAKLPKTGYAQGMLASYAKYLGLPDRMVLDEFTLDLENYQASLESGALEQASYQLPGEEYSYPVNSNPNSLLQSPTVLGTGRSYTPTSTARTRSQRFQQSSPLVNYYGNAYGSSIPSGSYNAGSYESAGYGSNPYETGNLYAQDAQRRYTSREVQSHGSQLSAATRRLPGSTAASTTGIFDPDATIVQQRIKPNQYVDDLTYSNDAHQFSPAAGRSTRRGTRRGSTPRPSVSRQRTQRSRQMSQRKPAQAGLRGFIERLLEDQNRKFIIGIGVIVLVLFLIILFSIKSCVSTATAPAEKPQVQVTATTDKKADTAEDTAAAQAAAQAAAASAKKEQKEAPKEVEVSVSLADGEVAWVEINLDGTSKVANTKTGSWEETYKVQKSITIQTNNPKALTVKNNGEDVSFEKKAGGVGTITIDGPQDTEENKTDSKDSKSDSQDKESSKDSSSGA